MQESCTVCGRQAHHTHHRRSKGDETKAREQDDYDPESPENKVPVCMECHEIYHMFMGQQVRLPLMPYKQHLQVRNAQKLVDHHGPQFVRMLPDWLHGKRRTG
jgi:hypothetical protein